MRYLLDTNVVSEPFRPRPDPAVVGWVEALEPNRALLSTISVGEIQKGVSNLGDGARRARLLRWLDDVPVTFEGRVLVVDVPVARAWGGIAHHSRRSGRPIGVPDGLLVATAVVHTLVIVTRNERDFRGRGVDVVNPWNR
jgi:hypothetical protein